MYLGADIIRIYIGLQTNSIQIQTRVNMLNNWIRSLNDKEELLEIEYDSELPEQYEQQYETVIAASLEMINNIKRQFFPEESNEDNENEKEIAVLEDSDNIENTGNIEDTGDSDEQNT